MAESASPSSPTLTAGASEGMPTAKNVPTGVKQAPKQAPRRMIRLGLNAHNAKSVWVVGNFNDWKPGMSSLTEFGSGNWFTYLPLDPGRYEYQFLVDGKRVDDPAARDYVSNPDGGKNAVLLVQ